MMAFLPFLLQLIWSSVNSSNTRATNNFEGSLDLREIKEVIFYFSALYYFVSHLYVNSRILICSIRCQS